jgi:rRNA-processing protein FCF1
LKVLVDTNGLMVPGQHGIDVFEELRRLGYDEFLVPSAVKEEIESLKQKVKGKDRMALGIAAGLLARCRIIEAPGSADDVLAALGKQMGVPVFTNDILLRKRLKADGVRSIFMRSRHKLEID